MNIEIAAICDAATANDVGGRMNILGAFDRIFAKFPLVIPQCSAAFRLRYQRAEAGTHQLSLSIEDVVGHPIVPPMQSEIELLPVVQGFDTAAVNMQVHCTPGRRQRRTCSTSAVRPRRPAPRSAEPAASGRRHER